MGDEGSGNGLLLIFEGLASVSEISFCSASLFIHEGATNIRELVYVLSTLLSSLQKFDFCIHIYANMPYQLPGPLRSTKIQNA